MLHKQIAKERDVEIARSSLQVARELEKYKYNMKRVREKKQHVSYGIHILKFG
jgi:hypothetical protein